jgi:hypothetical protein
MPAPATVRLSLAIGLDIRLLSKRGFINFTHFVTIKLSRSKDDPSMS